MVHINHAGENAGGGATFTWPAPLLRSGFARWSGGGTVRKYEQYLDCCGQCCGSEVNIFEFEFKILQTQILVLPRLKNLQTHNLYKFLKICL